MTYFPIFLSVIMPLPDYEWLWVFWIPPKYLGTFAALQWIRIYNFKLKCTVRLNEGHFPSISAPCFGWRNYRGLMRVIIDCWSQHLKINSLCIMTSPSRSARLCFQACTARTGIFARPLHNRRRRFPTCCIRHQQDLKLKHSSFHFRRESWWWKWGCRRDMLISSSVCLSTICSEISPWTWRA